MIEQQQAREGFSWKSEAIMLISAEVSLYTLRQPKLSPVIGEALCIFRAHGLEVKPGIMSTLITGDDDAVFDSLKKAFGQAAGQGQVVMHVSVSNSCPMEKLAQPSSE
jgi:uncharacterized protein YqgV (UPF0045/DUF77 family)